MNDPPGSPRLSAGNDELQRRRHDIGRGLRRNHYAVLAASVMVGLLALAAVWLSGEAGHQAANARVAQQRAEAHAADARLASTRLWEFSAHAARLQRFSRVPGQREHTLGIIREAVRLQSSRELRDEALSALLLPDVGTNLVWHQEVGFEVAATYDADLDHFIRNSDHGRAILWRATDGAVLMDEPGLGASTRFWQFSPDGGLAAIAFSGGQVGVWDWRRTNLVAQFPVVDARFAEPLFDFSPDGKAFWVLTAERTLTCHDLQSGKPTSVVVPGHPARFVRLSPSGKLAALACGDIAEVWDLSSRTPRASLALTNEIWSMGWDPAEERLALGCNGGVFLWNLGSEHPTTLETGAAIGITALAFTDDGNLLLAGGWNGLGEVWDVRQGQRVLVGGVGWPAQLSRDRKRIAITVEKIGYGIRVLLLPLGVRNWSSPPSLGESRWGAGLDPQERWVLTAHTRGWLLRDADSGQHLARGDCDLVGPASFTADGSNLVAWVSGGFARWPLEVQPGGTIGVLPRRVFDSTVPREATAACFSADRRFAAHCAEGLITVANTDEPNQRVEIRLRRPDDSTICLSPDGHWVITAHHNRTGLDLYDARAGRFIRTVAENQLGGPTFHPVTGQLITSTASGYELWQIPEGVRVKRQPWRVPLLAHGFLDFAPDGRLALVKAAPSAFQLFDLQTGRDFATLDFRDPQPFFGGQWSRDGRLMFLFGNDGGVTRVDLAALRAELHHLGLNWGDDNPSSDFSVPEPGATAGPTLAATPEFTPVHFAFLQNPARLAFFIAAALVATIGIGLYILRYQRRLFGNYLETEALAAQQQGELLQTQAALLRSEKMKALGTMAAGVAHDFNNLLSMIRLSNELIEEQTAPTGVTRENFQAIQQAVQRGHGIVNSMLGYARDDGQARSCAASELISEAVALLSKPFLSGLVLQIETEAATPLFVGRKGRLEQMLLNLILNAAEAMNGRGTLVLGARPVPAPGPCVLPPTAAPGYVELFVKDSGSGIPPDVLPRIFDPFFTTKAIGAQRGTGLGLSMLYAMAREDGVGVGVETEPGQGTTFRLLLPLTADSLAAASDSGSPSVSASPAGGDSPIATPS